MSYVDEVIERVIKENPNEPEFHQAVKEVLDSLIRWLMPMRKHSVVMRCLKDWSIPKGRSSSVCRGSMITVRFTSIPDTAFSSIAPSVPTRVD